MQLATLVHPNCHRSKEDFLKASQGNFRDEYLFELQQCYDSYKHIQKQIHECDIKIALLLEQTAVPKTDECNSVYKSPKKIKLKNCPPPTIAKNVFKLTRGIELLNVPGEHRHDPYPGFRNRIRPLKI